MRRLLGSRHSILSGGGVGANSLGVPDLGISTMEDVLIDASACRATTLPLLWISIRAGAARSTSPGTIRSHGESGVAAVHIEDQGRRETLRPSSRQSSGSSEEMVDRIKAAVMPERTVIFVLMARTDALASEGVRFCY